MLAGLLFQIRSAWHHHGVQTYVFQPQSELAPRMQKNLP